MNQSEETHAKGVASQPAQFQKGEPFRTSGGKAALPVCVRLSARRELTFEKLESREAAEPRK
jgi:hypothetical protein